MDKLKSCPFCGGEADIFKRTPFWKIEVYQARCFHCSAMIEQMFATEEKAIEAWNRRMSDEDT